MSVLACFLVVACSGQATSLSGPEDPEHGSPSVSSVEMTPADVELAVDGTANLSLDIRTEDGEPLELDGEWTVRDPTVVAVEDQGLEGQVKGLAQGRTRVIGTVDGVADSAEVEVTLPPSEPTEAEPAVVFDPDTYSSTQELMDDPHGVFGGAELGEDGDQGLIRLDTQVARPGGSQSMRYDYVDQGVGRSLHVGRRMPLPDKAKEVWVEVQARWSENFFAIQDFPDDGSTFAHKLLFGEVKATSTSPNWETSEGWSVSRWAVLWPGGGSSNPPHGQIWSAAPRTDAGESGVSVLGNTGVSAADYFDGRWHRIRVHMRHDPGLYELWIDGQLVQRVEGFRIHDEVDLTAILLGRNKDDGIESGTESLWWGKVSIWTQPPGW